MHYSSGSLYKNISALTCWLSSVKERSMFMVSSALLASIIPALNADTPTHATEKAKTWPNTQEMLGWIKMYATKNILSMVLLINNKTKCKCMAKKKFIIGQLCHLACHWQVRQKVMGLTSCCMRLILLLSWKVCRSLSNVRDTQHRSCSDWLLLLRELRTNPTPNTQPALWHREREKAWDDKPQEINIEYTLKTKCKILDYCKEFLPE